MIYAWTGDSEQACNQFAFGITNLSYLSYSQLGLNPFGIHYPGDPRFEKESSRAQRRMTARHGVFIRSLCWASSMELGDDPGPLVKYRYRGGGRVVSTSFIAVPFWTTSSSSRN
jgi:hypothetical protein